MMPWLFPQEFYNRYDNEDLHTVNEALQTLQGYLVTPFPTEYTLTPAQEDALAPLQSALGLYVDESLARFVTGEWDVTDEAAVAAYRQGLQERGLNEFLAFWQGIADGLAKENVEP